MRLELAFFIAALILAFGLSSQAEAKVTSVLSQEELSVCNAGLGHSVLNPQLAGGADRLHFEYEDFSVPGNSEARFRSDDLTVKSGGASVYAFGADVEPFEQNLLRTDFDLSTEGYGSSYFIDLCYRGAVEKKSNGNSHDDSEGIYQLSLNLQLDQDANGLYAQSANLVGNVSVQCDLRAQGQKRGPRKDNEKKPDGLENDLNYTSDTVAIRNSAVQLDLPLNTTHASVPRFCKIRVLLSESQTQSARLQNAHLKEVNINVSIDKQ